MLPWIFAHGSFESFSVIDPCSGLVGLEVKNKKKHFDAACVAAADASNLVSQVVSQITNKITPSSRILGEIAEVVNHF